MTDMKKIHDEYCDLGLRRLACAVIEGAIIDYRNAGKAIKRNDAKAAKAMADGDLDVAYVLMCDSEKRKNEMAVLARFFRSKRFMVLAPQLDSTAVIEALDRQIEKYDPSVKKQYKSVIWHCVKRK